MAVSADALQVYAGLEILTGAATADDRRAPRAPADLVPAGRRDVQRRPSTPSSRTRRSTDCSMPARARSSSAGRGSTCARRSPSCSCARGRRTRSARHWRRSSRRTVRPRCTSASRAGRRGPLRASIRRPPPDRPRPALLDLGELEPPEGPEPAVDRRHAAPDAPHRRWCRRARGAVRADRCARGRDARRRRRRRGPRGAGGGGLRGPRARRSGSSELLAGDIAG